VCEYFENSIKGRHIVSAVAGKKKIGGTHHYFSRSHIATYCTSLTGPRFLQAVLSAVLLPARNEGFYIWSWVENCKRWSDTTDVKPLARCTTSAFLFLDTTSFIALNDLSHSDVDTGIESNNVLIFYWYDVPIRFFYWFCQQSFNFYWYCVPAQLQHCI
jgi:hypothetical protein